jgi:hypothetical protein
MVFLDFGNLPFLDLGSCTVNVTTQFPAFRVFILVPETVQIPLDELATLKETVAFLEMIVTPTCSANDLEPYASLASKTRVEVAATGTRIPGFANTTSAVVEGAPATIRGTLIRSPLEVSPYCEPNVSLSIAVI